MSDNLENKKSFVMYLDYEEHFNLLTDEQLGKLIRAIMKYEKDKTIPKLDGATQMAFSFIKAQLDRDKEKWDEEVRKRSEAGKKGMAKRWGNKKDNKNNSVITENNKNNSVITENNKNNSVINDITRHNKNN